MVFQTDSLNGLQNNSVTEIAGTLHVVSEIKTDTLLKTPSLNTDAHTTGRLIKPISKIDSLFRVIEKKEAEIRKNKALKKIQADKVEEKSQKADSLPLQFGFYNNMASQNPLHKKTDFRNSAAALKPIFNTTKTLQNKNHNILKAEKLNLFPNDLSLLLILGISILIISLKKVFAKSFMSYIRTAFNYQLTYKLFRDKNVFQSRFNFILNVIYIVNLSVFIYQFIYFFDLNSNPLRLSFVYILTIILGIILIRYIVLNVLGEIFNVQKEYKEYLYNQLMFNKLLGLILLPLIFLVLYVPEILRDSILLLGALLIVVSFFVKLIRGYAIIIKKDVLIFYVLLYLCTLEILPVLVGITYIKRLI